MPYDLDYLLDILIAGRKVQRFTAGLTWEEFSESELVQSAVLHEFGVIGEAVRKLSPEIRATHSAVPWRSIIGLRNIVIHQYDRINLAEIWDIVQRDLLNLITAIEPLIPPENDV